MRNIRIMIAGQGHILGRDDIVKERNYTFSARCLSISGTLIKIAASEFLKKLKKDERAQQTMADISDQRDMTNIKKI